MRSIALVLFLAGLLPAARAGAAAQPSMKKLMTGYRKSYAVLPARTRAAIGKLRGIVGAEREAVQLDAKILADLAGASSREELLARKQEELTTSLTATARAKQSALARVRLGRMVGRAPKLAEADPAEVARGLKAYTAQLDGAARALREIDGALDRLPRSIAGAARIDQPYGNARVKDPQALARALYEVGEQYAKSFPGASVRQLEGLMMSRITQRLVAERPAFETFLRDAPVEQLHAEARDLIQEIRELAPDEQMRSETTLVGHGESTKIGVGQARALGGAAYSRTTAIAEQSHWDLTGRTLLPNGGNYTVKLRSSSLPLTESMYEGNATTGMLPVEARALLEKAVRLSEVFHVLGKRAPALAASMAPWMEQSRFLIELPEGKYSLENYQRYRATVLPRQIEYRPAIVVSMTRPGPDLLKLVPAGMIDAERAQMLEKDLDAKLTRDLR